MSETLDRAHSVNAETNNLDDKIIKEASERAGVRIRAFAQKLADEVGADVSNKRFAD